MTVQEAIARLQAIGYSLSMKGESILCCYGGPGEPDPEQVLPLIATLREHKAEALRLLRVADLLKRGVQQPEALRDVASCPSVALLQQQGGIPSPSSGTPLGDGIPPDRIIPAPPVDRGAGPSAARADGVAPELSSPLSAQGVTGPEEDRNSPAPPPARILSAPPAEAVNEYLRAVGARPRREEGRGVFAPALGPDGCCTNCGGDRWWLSWWNLLSCERCAPPPEPDRVRRRMGGPEALRLGNLRRGGETNA